MSGGSRSEYVIELSGVDDRFCSLNVEYLFSFYNSFTGIVANGDNRNETFVNV